MPKEMTQDIVFDFKWSRKQYEALTTEATEVLFGGAKGIINHCPITI